MTDQGRTVHPTLRHMWDRLTEIDEIGQLVLNVQLDIEGEMDYTLNLAMFHPKYLDKINLHFPVRVNLTRALCTSDHEYYARMWNLVLLFNTLRNNIAHGGDSGKRALHIKTLRQHMLKAVDTDYMRDVIKNGDEKDLLVCLAEYVRLTFRAMRFEMQGPSGVEAAERDRKAEVEAMEAYRWEREEEEARREEREYWEKRIKEEGWPDPEDEAE